MRTLVALLAALSLRAEFRAGVAKVDLDPPAGMPMSGYGARTGVAAGSLDPVQARVVVLSDGASTVAFVTLDLIFTFEPDEMDAIRKSAKDAGVQEVIFQASHTHSGPTYGANREAYRKAVERVRFAVDVAAKSRVPARIGAAYGISYIGHNRRYASTDGQVRMMWRNETKAASDRVDPAVGVIRIDRANGSPLAVLVHYSCHPVVFGPDNLMYSADWPGAMRDTVEKALEGSMAFFLQGAPGDINPYLDKTTQEANARAAVAEVGSKIGAEAARVARSIVTRAPEGLVAWKTETLAVNSRWDPAKLGEHLDKQFPTMDPARRARLAQKSALMPVTALVLFGEYAFVTMPGEPFVDFQMQLRARGPLPFTFLLGYANGGFMYFPTIAAAARGGYGAASATFAEPGTGERMLYVGLRSIYELLGRLKDKPAQ